MTGALLEVRSHDSEQLGHLRCLVIKLVGLLSQLALNGIYSRSERVEIRFIHVAPQGSSA